jgi:hypothetical protein
MKAIRRGGTNGALIPFTLRQNEQTIDHEFSIENQSKERNLDGRNRPLFLPTA